MQRFADNPILTREDIPGVTPHVVDVSSVFNPGAVRFQGRVRLLLRVQTRGRETVLMTADSEDGLRFTVEPRLVQIDDLASTGETIHHVYDPRLTEIEGVVYAVLAIDTDNGCHLAMARSADFVRFEIISFSRERVSRNGVLFPEKVGGRFLRLERPNEATAGGVATGDEIVLAESGDLVEWRPVGSVMKGRWHYWDELIGSGPPPIKTRSGWLHLYHGVATHFAASSLYQAGVVLLDLADPTRVLGRSRQNILEPRELYEQVGQVPNVVFPSGMIVESRDDEGYAPPDALTRVYYGAADTCVCLATTTIQELLDACG